MSEEGSYIEEIFLSIAIGRRLPALNAYGSSDYSKSGDSKKVYLYFNSNKNQPEFGLAILVDESNGQILEIKIC